MVVEVPVDAGEGVHTARDLTMWEQLSFAAFLQRYWADNQASTVKLLRKTPVPPRVWTKGLSEVELAPFREMCRGLFENFEVRVAIRVAMIGLTRSR